ncbi:tankyrase [Trichonephila inaurata madagascariensis]|uniref:Tankyrase n=1 Tax=Trichonephila inaurata madagascariensis TaxID=2747483 RepID=A0A8X7CJB9_9ARAC|nr:tankyrase [Trichonephila inaurata madagascariensis]
MENWIQNAVHRIGATYKNTVAVNVFYISAYFKEDEGICKHMFLGLIPDTEEVHSVVRLLQSSKLVELTYHSMFIVPPFIQKQTRNLLKEQNKEAIVLTVALGLVNYLLMCDRICALCINHAMSVLKYVSSNTELVNSLIGLPGRIAMCLVTENKLNEAISFCDSLLSTLHESVGESHKATLDIQYDLSGLLALKGNHEGAILHLQYLHEKNWEYSAKDETTLILITTAKELYESSKYEEALQFYRAIFGERKISESTSEIVLIALNKYALLLKDLGRHTEAIQVLNEVIEHGRKTSKFTVGILKMKSTIAHIHVDQRNFSLALEHFREVFNEMKDCRGENHPDTQSAKQDLAIALQHNGNYYEASKIFESIVEVLSEIYDEHHPNILNAQVNLADVLVQLRNYERAMETFEDLYHKYKIKFGEMHDKTLQMKSNIGFILQKQGQLYEAKDIFQEILEGFLIVFGPTDTLTTTVKTELKTLRILLPKHTATKYSAVLHDDENAIINFIENGACVNEEDNEGRTLLHHAAQNGYITAVEKLLEKGVMYNHEEFSGKTPVQLTSNNEIKNLFLLLESLFQDVKNGNCEKVTYFFSIRNGIINVKDDDGYSLLHWAVYKRCIPIVKLLLENGADVRSVSNLGNTVLHIASSAGNKEIMEILLQHADNNKIKELIDAKTAILGNTALHFAAANGHLEIVKYLLKHGAAFNLQNKKGKTPADISNAQPICILLNEIQGTSEGNSEALALP